MWPMILAEILTNPISLQNFILIVLKIQLRYWYAYMSAGKGLYKEIKEIKIQMHSSFQ